MIERAVAKSENVTTNPAELTKEPMGTSHFESGSRTTVSQKMSAMVSILQGETKGESVYYFDPESARGKPLARPKKSIAAAGPYPPVLAHTFAHCFSSSCNVANAAAAASASSGQPCMSA